MMAAPPPANPMAAPAAPMAPPTPPPVRAGGAPRAGGGVADIVAAQRAAGAWTLADAGDAGDEDAWATAIVLALLAVNYAGAHGEWELSARKARRWLARVGIDAAKIEAEAAAVLASSLA